MWLSWRWDQFVKDKYIDLEYILISDQVWIHCLYEFLIQIVLNTTVTQHSSKSIEIMGRMLYGLNEWFLGNLNPCAAVTIGLYIRFQAYYDHRNISTFHKIVFGRCFLIILSIQYIGDVYFSKSFFVICSWKLLSNEWKIEAKNSGSTGFLGIIIFQFEIIINVFISSFWFIWIPMLWVYGQ